MSHARRLAFRQGRPFRVSCLPEAAWRCVSIGDTVATARDWWPSGQPWYEASLSAGVTTTGTRWAIAEGEQGGPFDYSTYVLIANTDPVTAGTASVTLLYEDGTTDARDPVPLPAARRTTIDVSSFASAADKRFGIIVQSSGVPIVVERAFFGHAGGVLMAAGATSVATNITP